MLSPCLLYFNLAGPHGWEMAAHSPGLWDSSPLPPPSNILVTCLQFLSFYETLIFEYMQVASETVLEYKNKQIKTFPQVRSKLLFSVAQTVLCPLLTNNCSRECERICWFILVGFMVTCLYWNHILQDPAKAGM